MNVFVPWGTIQQAKFISSKCTDAILDERIVPVKFKDLSSTTTFYRWTFELFFEGPGISIATESGFYDEGNVFFEGAESDKNYKCGRDCPTAPLCVQYRLPYVAKRPQVSEYSRFGAGLNTLLLEDDAIW